MFVPAHSHKFIATLQAAQAGPAPVLVCIETRARHGAGKSTQQIIEERADIWAFLVHVLDIPVGPDDRRRGRALRGPYSFRSATIGSTPIARRAGR